MHWHPAQPPQPLDGFTVHIWRFGLDTHPDLSPLRDCLAPAELARADRYSAPAAARNFVVARFSVRRVLGAYLGIPPSEVPLTAGPYGKAILEQGSNPGAIEFNLAHSGDLGLVAVAREVAVGVDIERQDGTRNLGQLAKSTFSGRELDRWLGLPEAERPRAFFDTWARKEAFVKACGRGIGFGLRRFDVSVGPGPVRVESIDGDPVAAEGWDLHALDPGSGYSAALAAQHPGIRPELFDLTPV